MKKTAVLPQSRHIRTETIPSETPTGSSAGSTTAGVHAAAVVAGETSKPKPGSGMSFEPVFSTPGVHPYDEIEWEKRTAEITVDSG
jgi:hypothetical protein